MRILSRPKADLLARESGWKPYVHACYKRALVRVAKRAHTWTEFTWAADEWRWLSRRAATESGCGGGSGVSGGRVIPWTHCNCVSGDVTRGSGQVNRMLRWASECGEWRQWKVEMEAAVNGGGTSDVGNAMCGTRW